MLKLTKEEESFIQKWTVIHHEKGEFYYIPYYFKKNQPSDPRKKEDTVWEIMSFDHLPNEIREMIIDGNHLPDGIREIKEVLEDGSVIVDGKYTGCIADGKFNPVMKYTKIDLFGKKQSKGTFNDFYDLKYSSIQDAYKAKDYVKCDFVKDEEGIIYIRAYNIKNPEKKKYYRLMIQRPYFGIDVADDNAAAELATTLF